MKVLAYENQYDHTFKMVSSISVESQAPYGQKIKLEDYSPRLINCLHNVHVIGVHMEDTILAARSFSSSNTKIQEQL